MKEEEKQDQTVPCPVKLEISSVIVSFNSFFAIAETALFIPDISYAHSSNSGKPVDRAFAVFRPPSLG